MEAPDAIKWLNDLGVVFDKDEERPYGYHTRRRNFQKKNACMQRTTLEQRS